MYNTIPQTGVNDTSDLTRTIPQTFVGEFLEDPRKTFTHFYNRNRGLFPVSKVIPNETAPLRFKIWQTKQRFDFFSSQISIVQGGQLSSVIGWKNRDRVQGGD